MIIASRPFIFCLFWNKRQDIKSACPPLLTAISAGLKFEECYEKILEENSLPSLSKVTTLTNIKEICGQNIPTWSSREYHGGLYEENEISAKKETCFKN